MCLYLLRAKELFGTTQHFGATEHFWCDGALWCGAHMVLRSLWRAATFFRTKVLRRIPKSVLSHQKCCVAPKVLRRTKEFFGTKQIKTHDGTS